MAWALVSDFRDFGGLEGDCQRRVNRPEPDWPGSAAARARCSNEYRRLLPAPPEHWFGSGAEVWRDNDTRLEVDEDYWWNLVEVEVALLPFAPAGRSLLPTVVRWIKHHLVQAHLSEPAIAKLLVDPARMIVVAYWLIRRRARVLKAIPEYMHLRRGQYMKIMLDESFVCDEFISAMLCLAALGGTAFLRGPCDLCFREAAPTLRRCAEHSMAKENLEAPGDRARPAAAVRMARKMEALYGDRRPPWHAKGEGPLRLGSRAAGMLWSYCGKRHAAWVRQMERNLSRTPIVRSLLPPDFARLSHRAQLQALRNGVDPNHWQIDLWPQKIRAAEAWFTEERRLIKPRPKGMWPINRDRVATAHALLENGLTKSEVAGQLGISRSYLSQLLKRARPAAAARSRR